MKTNTKISLINIACAFGLGALVWYTKKKCDEPVSGIGATERIKRRIYKEVSLAQSAGVDFSKRYADLTKAEKKALEKVGKQVGWKQSKRSIESGKPYVESYFGSLRRAWNAVSGVSGIGRAYDVKDAQGNVCLTWIEDAAQHVSRENDIEEKRQRALEAEKRAADARKRMKAAQRKIDKDGMLPAAPVAPVAPVIEKPKNQTAQKRKEAGYDERYKLAMDVWDKSALQWWREKDVIDEKDAEVVKQFPNRHAYLADAYARKALRSDNSGVFIKQPNGEFSQACGAYSVFADYCKLISQAEKEARAQAEKERVQAGWEENKENLDDIRRALLDRAKLMQVVVNSLQEYKDKEHYVERYGRVREYGNAVSGDERYNYLDKINYIVWTYSKEFGHGGMTYYPIRSYPDYEGAEHFVQNRYKTGAKILPVWEVPIEKITGIGYAAAQQPFWYNIPSVQFISHGEWADPEIYYKGKYYNAVEAGDELYEIWRSQIEYGDTDLDFDAWMYTYGGDYLKSEVLQYM